MIGLFIFLNVLYARAFELPASWSVAPKVYSQDKARDVVRCLTSQIRLNPRPVIMASSNMSPSPWRLDAGMCVIHERSNAVACLPSLIIIGAMKAGTAELQGWLSQHPALYRWKGASRSGNGEPHFFDKLTSDAELEAGWSKYLWEGFSISESLSFIENRYTFEKTPAYLRMSPAGIARMARMLPSVRMIAILREPASRAYSHFQQRYKALSRVAWSNCLDGLSIGVAKEHIAVFILSTRSGIPSWETLPFIPHLCEAKLSWPRS
eukprot:TRINITY_DN11421_c0_g1_i2.p1 TRINITY_DN11421_c0_g1~~TRINITY_DN11421_c0_g1_i2.p1  ORF type:complete len:265 (+),score=3.36 TRINITY_DN11421_c0_g1_i2:129-923(+)